jgi:hypothetical protein
LAAELSGFVDDETADERLVVAVQTERDTRRSVHRISESGFRGHARHLLPFEREPLLTRPLFILIGVSAVDFVRRNGALRKVRLRSAPTNCRG